MFSTAGKGDNRFDTSARERIFSGKGDRGGSDPSPVVGRLISGKSIGSFSGKEALLAVISGHGEVDPCEDARTVGVVRISEGDGYGGLPCPSITVSDLPPECNGRIALLDPDGEKLFVSPDIVTVNKYVPRLCRDGVSVPPSHIRRGGREIRLSLICKDEPYVSEWGGGIFIAPPADYENEEELYAYYADIAERSVGRSAAVMLSAAPLSHIGLRALLRAAVWGELSLVLCGILTESELTEALSVFCGAFCELETERREFNGYLPRGLRIDSPYLLSVAKALCGVDIFVYDAERLAALLCGGRKSLPEEIVSRLLDLIRDTALSRSDLRHGVILGKSTLSPRLCLGLADCGISDFVTSPEYMPRLAEILRA